MISESMTDLDRDLNIVQTANLVFVTTEPYSKIRLDLNGLFVGQVKMNVFYSIW